MLTLPNFTSQLRVRVRARVKEHTNGHLLMSTKKFMNYEVRMQPVIATKPMS